MTCRHDMILHIIVWICRVYCEETVLNENELDIDITRFYESLLKLDTNCEIAFIAKAAYLKNTDNLINSRECLNRAISINMQSFVAWFMLSQIQYKLYCWEETENATIQALRFIKSNQTDKLHHKIKLILVDAMSRSNDKQKLMQARQMCEEVSITYSCISLAKCLLIHDKTINAYKFS